MTKRKGTNKKTKHAPVLTSVTPKRSSSRQWKVRTKNGAFVEGAIYPPNTVVKVSRDYYERVKRDGNNTLEIIK